MKDWRQGTSIGRVSCDHFQHGCCPRLSTKKNKGTFFQGSCYSWSAWKALEFNFGLQGHLKSPWKRGFCGKLLENCLNFCVGESCRDCIMRRENEDHAELKTRHLKNWSNWLYWGKINAKIKMPVHALNLQDVGKNISVGFFSKENTETRCMA